MSKKEYGVFGLGDFGRSIAVYLAEQGHTVMALDCREERVQAVADVVTMAVRADVMDFDMMRSLNLGELSCLIIAMGDNLEGTIMAAIVAREEGVPYIMAKANNTIHETVLRRLGVDRVIFPDKDMAARIARNLISGRFTDFMELSDTFGVAEMPAPEGWVGKTLRHLHLREMGLNVIGLRRGEEVSIDLDPDRPICRGEVYILIGPNEAMEKLL